MVASVFATNTHPWPDVQHAEIVTVLNKIMFFLCKDISTCKRLLTYLNITTDLLRNIAKKNEHYATYGLPTTTRSTTTLQLLQLTVTAAYRPELQNRIIDFQHQQRHTLRAHLRALDNMAFDNTTAFQLAVTAAYILESPPTH